MCLRHEPLTWYIKLRVAHAPGIPGTFSPPPRISDPHMHHGTCVTHVPWCMPGSLTSGFLWSRWRHSRRMHNSQFYVSGKRPMDKLLRSCNTVGYISHPCPNIKNSLSEPLWNLGHGWMITLHIILWDWLLIHAHHFRSSADPAPPSNLTGYVIQYADTVIGYSSEYDSTG